MSDLILNITGEEDFEKRVLKADLPVLVDFWAPWCGPCKMVLPELDFVAETVKEKALVAKVNIDENAELAKKYHVRGVPTFLLIKEGKEEKRIVGANMRDDLIAFIER